MPQQRFSFSTQIPRTTGRRFSSRIPHVTGRQFLEIVLVFEIILILFAAVQTIIFATYRIFYQLHTPNHLLLIRKLSLWAAVLFSLTKIYLLRKALKQPSKVLRFLKLYYRVFLIGFLPVASLAIYGRGDFIPSKWNFQTYIGLFFYAIALLIIVLLIRAVRNHIQRLKSPVIYQLRDHLKFMRNNIDERNNIDDNLPKSNAANLLDDVASQVSCELVESHVISPLDILIDHSPIGDGTFGIVYKGIFVQDDVTTDIVLKVAKMPEVLTDINTLVQEMKTNIAAGDHPNIVKFYGVTSDANLNCNFGIVIEYCSNGSLEDFLLSRQKEIDFEKSSSSPNSNEYVDFTLQVKDLLRYAHQICLGMEHLAVKKIVHGDLATRNILVTESFTMKIADFGMSHRLYNYQMYHKLDDKNTLLPWRWLSIEAIEYFKFSEKSDVWSYGVVLWELFTLGKIPYDEFSWHSSFTQIIRNGYRLSQPPFANTEMYQVMNCCWQIEKEQRPNFKVLACIVAKVIHSDYVLNETVFPECTENL